MFKKIIISIFTIVTIFTLGACNNDEPNIDDEEQTNADIKEEQVNDEKEQQDKAEFIKEALTVMHEYDETNYEERYDNVGNYFAKDVYEQAISEEYINPDKKFISTIEIYDIYQSTNNENKFVAIYNTFFAPEHDEIPDDIGTDVDLISEIVIEEQDGSYLITEILNTPKPQYLTDEEVEAMNEQEKENEQ